MNLTEKTISFNGKSRLRPIQSEGYYIQYRLKTSKTSFSQIAKRMKVTAQFVSFVTFGLRRSQRIEAEIARILGKDSWNDVVLEARSEIQKKPIEVIIREMEQKAQQRKIAERQRMADYITENRKRPEGVIRNKTAGRRGA